MLTRLNVAVRIAQVLVAKNFDVTYYNNYKVRRAVAAVTLQLPLHMHAAKQAMLTQPPWPSLLTAHEPTCAL